MANPVLEATRLRVDVVGASEGRGVDGIDGLSFATTGERVLVLAAPGALFRAAAGLLRPRHGTLATDGLATERALREGLAAGAAIDPALPPTWTVREYVTWSARLAGYAKRDAETRAAEALTALKLDSAAAVRLLHAPLTVRRSVVVGAALVTGATTLFLEDPLRDLPEDAARSFARVLLRATSGLRTVVFSPRASLPSPLAIDADEALIVDGHGVLAQGAPAEVASRDRSYALRLHGGGKDFARLAEKRGARVSGRGPSFTVDLGDALRPNDLLDVAAAAGAVILELRPLSFAFA